MKTRSEQINLLLLAFGIFLGAYARFFPAVMVGFPITDGGMFYMMTQALLKNHYALPAFVEYNGFAIPFAYPPLGFYLTALVSQLLHVPLIEVFIWLPAVLSVLIVIAFYPLAVNLLQSPFKATLATTFFALLPHSQMWYIMGGGITRAPGQIFLLLTLLFAYKLFTAPTPKYLWLTILCGGGVVLSHPEEALHTVALCGVLWLFFGRSKEGVKNALLVALGVAVLAAPFLFTVISRHGLEPYRNASGTGFHNFTAWITLFTGTFSDEKFVTLISALALLGFVIAIARREYLLVAMLIVPGIIDPRSAGSICLIGWSLLAAVGFADVVLAGLSVLENKTSAEFNPLTYFLNSTLAKTVTTALIFYSFFGTVTSDQVFLKVSLTAPQRAALQWISENVPAQSRFAVVTGGNLAFSDAVSEWFPALTGSVSVGTVQGREWLGDKRFASLIGVYDSLQLCLNQTPACLEDWSTKNGTFEYVLVTQNSALSSTLTAAPAYRSVYQQDGISIFKRIP